MIVTKTRYSKVFLSKTEDVCAHNDGSGIWKKIQTQNEEDKRIREEIKKTFVLKRFDEGDIGFDGRFLYSFRIEDDLYLSSSLRNKSKKVRYTTTVDIEKAGKGNTNSQPSDLEIYLKDKRFKPQK